MTTSVVPARPIGGLAVAIGAVTIIGIVAISLFYAVGGFFGPLNDLCNAAEAVLTGVLAWRCYPLYRAKSPGLARVTLVLATIEDLPHKQIAEILEIPEGTVAWRVNEARRLLRQLLSGTTPGSPKVRTTVSTAND